MTHRLVIALFTAFIGLVLTIPDADARRLGGGRSFGRQSGNVAQRQAPAQPTPPGQKQSDANQSPTQPQPGATPQPQRNRWLGPVAGLAAGLGIAALMSHLGFGGAFGEMLSSFLLIGLLLFAGLFLYRMLKRSQASPTSPPSYAGASTAPPTPRAFEVQQPMARQSTSGPVSVTGEPLRPLAPASAADSAASSATWSVPADFDVEGFLRSAKVYFVRLQAAWDSNDQADIREFTTPEMFAEIKVDLAERGTATNQTDVVELDAEFLGIEEQGRNALASVRFHGLLRETPGTPPAPFSEVWNLVKPLSGKQGWLLAGIQQLETA